MSLVQNFKFQNNFFLYGRGEGMQLNKLKMWSLKIFIKISSHLYIDKGLPVTDNISETTVQHLNLVLKPDPMWVTLYL